MQLFLGNGVYAPFSSDTQAVGEEPRIQQMAVAAVTPLGAPQQSIGSFQNLRTLGFLNNEALLLVQLPNVTAVYGWVFLFVRRGRETWIEKWGGHFEDAPSLKKCLHEAVSTLYRPTPAEAACEVE